MAVDALGLALSDMKNNKILIPTPTEINKIIVEEDSFLIIIEFDMKFYKKLNSSKAVKKTLSILEWLNEEAINKGINFSQVLQEALVKKFKCKIKYRKNIKLKYALYIITSFNMYYNISC